MFLFRIRTDTSFKCLKGFIQQTSRSNKNRHKNKKGVSATRRSPFARIYSFSRVSCPPLPSQWQFFHAEPHGKPYRSVQSAHSQFCSSFCSCWKEFCSFFFPEVFFSVNYCLIFLVQSYWSHKFADGTECNVLAFPAGQGAPWWTAAVAKMLELPAEEPELSGLQILVGAISLSSSPLLFIIHCEQCDLDVSGTRITTEASLQRVP